ncbi:MAG: glycosyltransferase [Candidatus Aegiribacteria sp.]|nr:glycosyltransferase [Candidatus Aegiribacteria sp.]MBD3295367.1 glycosyltransferase [Candidatus Fermentibacteria bacterium]
MKTAIVGPFPPYRGGIAQFSQRLLNSLKSCFPKHEFVPVSYRRLYPGILFPGTSQFQPEGGAATNDAAGVIDSVNPLCWISARNFFSKRSFDSVVVQWWHPFFAPCLAASIPGAIKTAAVCHNVIPHESFPFSSRIAEAFLRRISGLVVHSRTDLEAARNVAPNKQILKLYHPIYDQYRKENIDRSSARSDLGYSDDARIVLFFGLVRPYKGVQDLLRAMGSLPEDINLLIVGECYSGKDEILAIIDDLGLKSRIRWIDRFVPDEEVALYFNAANIVALPYREATQSGVAQIALSFGRVLVLTDTGGLSELVEEGSTGFLAEPWSPASLAGAIRSAFQLDSDASTEKRIREKASEFSWENYSSKLMKLLS